MRSRATSLAHKLRRFSATRSRKGRCRAAALAGLLELKQIARRDDPWAHRAIVLAR